MIVWTVSNNFGDGDMCHFDNYLDAFHELESVTEESEDISDDEWYGIFRGKNYQVVWQMLNLQTLKEKEISIGEWKLTKKHMKIKQFEDIGEFEGW